MVTRDGEIIVSNFRGINVKDNAFNIDDSNCREGTNLVVTDGAVQVRPGLDVFSSNPDVTGGITMLTPYVKRDGTKQLVFANQNKYYFITPDDPTWMLIGTYGTEVDNPHAFQYKNVLLFGTGKVGNTQLKYDAVSTTYTANTIAFVDSNPDTITDSANGFGDFRAGDYIIVSGSVSNDGQYLIVAANASTLNLAGFESITPEAAGANITISSSGLSIVGNPANSISDVGFFTQFCGKDVRLVMAAGSSSDDPDNNSTTLYFASDPNDWTSTPAGAIPIGPSDGTDITGMVQKDNLVVYKNTSKHYMDSFYEELSGEFALREFGVDNSSGAPNHDSLVVIDGDIVTLVAKGRSIEGYGLDGTAQGNGRPKQYSTYINPILDQLNWNDTIIKRARGEFYDRKAFYACPFQASQFNNLLLVGDWDTPTQNAQPSWTTWGKSIGSMTKFRDDNSVERFYLGDANSPQIYILNPNQYSDNGSGYTRRWKSKKFSLGRQTDYNDAIQVIIEGFMTLGTEFFLKANVDGKTQTWKITKDQLINSANGGGYIGDHYIGDEIIGGNGVESNKFRYQAVCSIPNALRYCKNIEIEIYNSAPGQYWSMDYLSINEKINLENLPNSSKNVQGI